MSLNVVSYDVGGAQGPVCEDPAERDGEEDNQWQGLSLTNKSSGLFLTWQWNFVAVVRVQPCVNEQNRNYPKELPNQPEQVVFSERNACFHPTQVRASRVCFFLSDSKT